MTAYLPEIYKMGTLVSAAAAPTAILSGDGVSNVERYGIGGVMLVVASLFYSMWRKESEARQREHRAQIAYRDEEIKRLRQKAKD